VDNATQNQLNKWFLKSVNIRKSKRGLGFNFEMPSRGYSRFWPDLKKKMV
jgi:hypothetical protein